jgi:RNA polymerase sigma factor (sigma-70 family)
MTEPGFRRSKAKQAGLPTNKGRYKMISVDLFDKAAIDIAADVLVAPRHQLAKIEPLRRKKFVVISMAQEDEEGNMLELPDPDSLDPEAELVKAETRDRIHSMLKDLDATDRAAIIMRYWYDFSEAEIAGALRLTVSAVKNHLHCALKELARSWQEEELLSKTEKWPYESPAF